MNTLPNIWYYADRNEQIGPLTQQQLLETLATLPNAADVLVWCDKFSDWKPAADASAGAVAGVGSIRAVRTLVNHVCDAAIIRTNQNNSVLPSQKNEWDRACATFFPAKGGNWDSLMPIAIRFVDNRTIDNGKSLQLPQR